MPKVRNPDAANELVEAAARVLAEEGPPAVTARRMAQEIGASTMAVYTHFGSMDDLLAEVWRVGFSRFGAALDQPAVSDDPVADWLTQGWAYRRFALDNQHLYQVMFGDAVLPFDIGEPADHESAMGTFGSLLARMQRCMDAGRFSIDDLRLAGEAVWAGVHGHVTIELTGYFRAMDRDPAASYTEVLRRLALGFGDQPGAVAESMRIARRRARRRPGLTPSPRPAATASGSARRASGS